MIRSTTSDKRPGVGKTLISVLLWLAAWQALAVALDQRILLCSPVEAISRLFVLASQTQFWLTVADSLCSIALGFLLAVIIGAALATLSNRFSAVEQLISPIIFTIKAAPVASFIILLLIWLPTSSLPCVISFMMAMPIIYEGTLSGIREVSCQLIEMADTFKLPLSRRIRYIYFSQIMPYFKTACETSAGLCFKAGIAAEVIAMPKGSIGERLYQAKIYLDTPDLFAWTIVVILLSVILTKLLSPVLNYMVKRMERM